MYVYVNTYIYIYIEREREIYIYIEREIIRLGEHPCPPCPRRSCSACPHCRRGAAAPCVICIYIYICVHIYIYIHYWVCMYIVESFFRGKHKQTTREQSVAELTIQHQSFAAAPCVCMC